jgi:hypothetical protein
LSVALWGKEIDLDVDLDSPASQGRAPSSTVEIMGKSGPLTLSACLLQMTDALTLCCVALVT